MKDKITKENQLVVMVEQSGLEKTKADYMLEKFSEYFSIASEWEKRAKEIVVTDESQKDVMAIARIGRLALRERRINLEKERKRLKEQSLREGKAIDGIANVLKALIIPIEDYLDKQENYIKYKKAEEERLAKIEAEKKAEAERIAKAKAEAAERERIKLENEKLKKEAEKRERQIAKERAKAEAKLKAEREAAAKKQMEQAAILAAEKAKAEAERKAAQEREQRAIEKAAREKEKIEKELKARAEAERIAKEKAEADEIERIRLEMEQKTEKMKNIIICPKCGHKISGNKEQL